MKRRRSDAKLLLYLLIRKQNVSIGFTAQNFVNITTWQEIEWHDGHGAVFYLTIWNTNLNTWEENANAFKYKFSQKPIVSPILTKSANVVMNWRIKSFGAIDTVVIVSHEKSMQQHCEACRN